MKRLLLPLIVVVLALLGGLLWFQLRRVPLAESNTASATPTDTRDATKLSAQAEALTAPDASDTKAERAIVSAPSSASAMGGVIVEGEVRAPDGCALDSEVEVFALARPADLDTLMTQIGPRRSDASSANDFDPKFVVARAKLDSNGRFRLSLPNDTAKAHLIAAGRAWLLRETITVDVRSGATRVALQAECGGWIAAKIDLPVGETAASALDGEIAQLSMSLTNFAGGPGRMASAFRRNERRASLRDGRVELWALDPEQSYTLDLATQNFADATVEVPEVARGAVTNVALRLDRGGAVTGRVLDADMKPVADAIVEAQKSRGPFGFSERVVRKTTTGADGTYELAAVAAGSVQVSARSKELPTAEAQKVEVAEKGRVSGIDFKLGAGETIAGIVRWKDGTPAAGAEISASADRGQGFGGGGGGQFRMPARRGDDPKFIADNDGRFVVKGLASGTFTLAAERLKPEDAAQIDERDADARRRSAWRARATGIKSGTADAALTLEAPLVVRGVVTALADGKPVAKFRVQASSNEGGGRRGAQGAGGGMAFAFGGNQRLSQDVANERGEFTFTFQRDGSYKLTISADGFVTSDGVDVEVPVKADAPPLAITLARGAIVQGIVRSPSGAPVANATVAPVSTNAGMFGGRVPGMGDDTIKARTDANGHFALLDLKAGRLVLVAESSTWAKSDELGLDLVAGQTITDAALVMHQGGSIVGESFEDGRPTAGRNITAMDMKSFASASARADSAGRFRMDHLAPGAWRVTAMPAASEIETMGGAGRGGGDGGMGAMFSKMKSVNADVVEAQETRVVLGAPPEAPVLVKGKVTQGAVGVGGVRVTFMGQGDSFGPGMKTAQSAADGAYSIQLDKPGDYSVTVQQGGARSSMLEFVETVKAGAEAIVDLALPTARISGRVRTPEGDAARNVRVTLVPASMSVGGSMMGGGFNEITTNDEGNFDVNTLRAGTYTLTVGGSQMGGFRGPGGGSGGEAKYGRKVVADIQLAESEWRKDLDVRLENAAGVDVEVVDDRGSPVLGASVFARDESGRAVDRLSSVRTDANGKARYSGLAPGVHTFSARKETLSSAESGKVDVRSTGSASVKITLSQGTLLTVTTIDADDQPLRARVSVTDESGRDVAGLMSTQDLMERMTRGGPGGNEQKIGPLAPGKYKVKAVATDGKTVEKSVTLTGQAERKMTLSFSR